MLFALSCFVAAFAAGLTTMVYELRRAPEGHEDSAGFHGTSKNPTPSGKHSSSPYAGRSQEARTGLEFRA